jgi:flotillin
VLPVLQKAFQLSLKQRQVPLNVTGQDKNFIKVNVGASINFKFADSEADVRKAAQRFLTHTDAELNHSIQQSLEGSLRSIVGSMTIEDINSNRAQFQNEVLSSAKTELADQGIHIDVLNISDIQTPGSTYLEDLAKPEAARVRQIAAGKDSEAKQISEFARINTETNVAEKDKDLKIKVAGFQAETDHQQAVADAAGQLSKAEQDVEVAKLEREALTQRALVEAERLDITEKKPADAAAYSARVKAEGERDTAKATAEGTAYQRTTLAKASQEAAVYEATGKAESMKLGAGAAAEAISVKGQLRPKPSPRSVPPGRPLPTPRPRPSTSTRPTR